MSIRYNLNMQSIRELFRIGHGPSSSHTMGPHDAAALFSKAWPQAASFRAYLYGSLAATGKGHMTDLAIQRALAPKSVDFVWHPDILLPGHPNGMRFEALDEQGNVLGEWQGYSIGGGSILAEGETVQQFEQYNMTTLTEIMLYCINHGITYWEYVEQVEGPEIWEYLAQIYKVMMDSIERGLDAEGVLPGGLGLPRKAATIQRKVQISNKQILGKGDLASYALAVAEENASGGLIVTAPTGGSAGILPAVLRFLREKMNIKEKSMLHALATAGLIGNLIKSNASVSGAEVGCQGEVGAACSMAAAAATQLMGGTVRQIEYAAEMGLEHHLGLTCDPVGGLVQIPCIERNVFAASRAIDSANYALFSDGSHRVPFDDVVLILKQTGHDLPSLYRETAAGGLATMYQFPHGDH